MSKEPIQINLEKIPPKFFTERKSTNKHWVMWGENDMTFEAIGLILAKPPNTVKSWHRRAIMALREKLHQKISE